VGGERVKEKLAVGEVCLMLQHVGGGGVFFAGLVSLTFPYSSELLLGGGWFASRVSLCVRVRRLGAFGFMEVVF